MADKFDKFNDRARRVLTLAHEEAARFNHNYIGTEHLLLGLLREGDGVGARVLVNLGVGLPRVREAVEFIIGRGVGQVVGEVGLTPRAKKVIELAVEEARGLNHHYIGTEHLLLGLAREGEGIAAGVLESLGLRMEQVRAQVLVIVNQSDIPLQGQWQGRPLDIPSLRELVHVLPIAQTQGDARFQITLVSLEIYTDGLLLHYSFMGDDIDFFTRGMEDVQIEVAEAPSTRYTGVARQRGRYGQQWRWTNCYQPGREPGARQLRISLPLIRWSPRLGEERTAGPWSFTVALPPASPEA